MNSACDEYHPARGGGGRGGGARGGDSEEVQTPLLLEEGKVSIITQSKGKELGFRSYHAVAQQFPLVVVQIPFV